MKNIEKLFLAGVCVVSLLASTSTVMSAARSNVAMDYLYKNPALGSFTAGFYGGQAEREISRSGPLPDTTMTSSRGYVYLGYDLVPWLNLYGIAGANQAKLTGSTSADGELLYGVGVSMNLLNHFIREPTPMEDLFRINADVRLISTKAEFMFNSVSWQELSASLRFSLVNFPEGDKNYRPEAIALYAGPAFSYIQSSDIESKDEFGVIGGLEIFFYDALSLDLNVEYIGETSFFGGINIRF